MKKIPRTKKSPLDYLSSRNLNSFSAVSPNEVQNIIGSLKSGKAVGPYSIPIFLLKLPSQYISFPLSDIINSSFVNGIFPDLLKLAKVVPLYKKQSPNDPNNYRPISLLSVFSKIIEKLMYTRLYNFLENYKILYLIAIWFSC